MSKGLTLIDLEDFVPVLQLDGEHNGIEDEHFIQKQYEHFMKITALNTALDHREHSKLQKFKSFVLKDTEAYKKSKIRRNYLFNLIYNKYMFDIQSIKSQNVFNNFYFNNAENGVIKQFFVAVVQVLFTILLLFEIIGNFDDIDFENDFNVILAIIVTYLSFVLIKPQISSIVHDLRILETYFTLAKLNTILNITANIVLALVLPWVTFFVILNSETMTDIVLNATAIAFIIELDDDAADEVDLENWFVSATASFEDIFKNVIEFNNPIITSDDDGSKRMRDKIEQEINNVQDALKDKNTKLEYFESDLCGKIKHMMKNIAFFILTPILIYEHPFNIMLDICSRIKRKDAVEENTLTVPSKEKYVAIKEEELNAGRTELGTSQNVEEEKAPLNTESTAQTLIPSRELIHDDVNPQNTKEVNDSEREQIAKALTLNQEGNCAVYEHKYNAAYLKYTQGIKLLIEYYSTENDERKYNEDDEDIFDVARFKSQSKNVILLRVISILYYNHGFALYLRAKQSWFSEIITNENGHPFTNYNNARKSCYVCIECLSYLSASDTDLDVNRRSAMCHKLISDIYYNLFQFEEAEEHYTKYINIFTLKPDDKRLLQIQQRKSENHAPYLKILDDARKHILVDCGHIDNECPFRDFERVCYLSLPRKRNLVNLTEIDVVLGKFHWFLSESHVISRNMRRLNKAQKQLEQSRVELIMSMTRLNKMKSNLKEFELRYESYDDESKSEEIELRKQITLQIKQLEESQLETQKSINDIDNNIQSVKAHKKTFADKRMTEAQNAQEIDNLYGWSLFKANTSANSATSIADIIATFTNSIEFEPDQPYYYFIRGSVYYQMERKTEALNDFEKAQALNDKNLLFKLKAACCKADINGWDSIKSNAFIDILKPIEMLRKPRMQLKRTLIAHHQMGLLDAYFGAATKHDDEIGTNAKQYETFLAGLEETQRQQFKMHASFEDLCGVNEIINIQQMMNVIDVITDIEDIKFGNMAADTDIDQINSFLSYLEEIQESQKHYDQSEVDPSVHINDYNKKYKVAQDSVFPKLLQHSNKILEQIQTIAEYSDDAEGLTEDEWTYFVKRIPRSLVETYDTNEISTEFAESQDLNQHVLKQHGFTFEKYQIGGIIEWDQFKLILNKLHEIQDSNLKIKLD